MLLKESTEHFRLTNIAVKKLIMYLNYEVSSIISIILWSLNNVIFYFKYKNYLVSSMPQISAYLLYSRMRVYLYRQNPEYLPVFSETMSFEKIPL